MYCNESIHLYLHEDGYIECPFCDKQIQRPSPHKYTCCLVCKSCGSVHGYKPATEYIDFYESRYKIKRKSVYHRKYHIINVMNDIAQTNGIQIGYYDRENIPRIFKLIDNVTHQSGVCRKHIISVNL